MKIPLSWLREYVDITVPVEELAHRLTMAGTEVGQVITIGGWTGCSVGHVLSVERHPNADRLSVCAVDTGGGETMHVVCGAPNVAQGQRIAFARVGAMLYSTHSGVVEELKAAKIRGVVSEGMICSELELSIGEDHDGILVLPDDAPIGMDLTQYMGDQVLDLEVTPNRPDCLSVLGVAREVAALTGATVHEPDGSYSEEGQPIDTLASVEIADPDLCRRYTATLITGIQVGPSPRWMQDRLLRAGMRPINNVVDVTNYVMLEYNQPLHAFDFATVKQSKVVVRRARPGETLVTLDGVERKLSPTMLMIADTEDAVGVAGVIGGAHSEMTEGTTSVLLESATFDPVNNRRTAQALRLPTEASIRFEKGLRPEMAPIALRRATRLIQEVAGGAVARGIIDIFPEVESYRSPRLTLTMARLEKVLGIKAYSDRALGVLDSLGFEPSADPNGDIQVEVPYWRSDVTIEDDLVEEVARIVGYDEVPTTMLSTPVPHHRPEPLRELRERVRDLLVGCGLQEVITYTVTSLDNLARVGALENSSPIKLLNPLNAEEAHLRTTLRAGLLSTLAANVSHERGPIAIFETGRVYLSRDGDLPEEREMVAGVLSGTRNGEHWLADSGEIGFYDAKGTLESILTGLAMEARFEPAADPSLHPGKCARVTVGDVDVGTVGEVHPSVAESFGLDRSPAALFELDLHRLLDATPSHGRHYSPMGRFPSAFRDVAVVVDREVPADRLRQIIEGHRLVGQVSLFDVYSGGGVPAGKRSLAYRIRFQAADRTLTAEEVTQALESVVRSLERDAGAQLRAGPS